MQRVYIVCDEAPLMLDSTPMDKRPDALGPGFAPAAHVAPARHMRFTSATD